MQDIFQIIDNFARYKDVESVLTVGELTDNIPEVTIAIPTYKRPKLLCMAIQSALDQKYNNNYEIIIVDNEADFSQETETEKAIKTFSNPRILYYKNERNIGMFGNWNRCIELARSEWLTILNDDDWLEPNYLSAVMDFKNKKKTGLFFVRVRIQDFRKQSKPFTFKDRVKELASKIRNNHYTQLSWFDFFCSPQQMGSLGILFSKKQAIAYGGFNPDWYPASDYYFFSNLALAEQSYRLNQLLANYRIAENESFNVGKEFPMCTLVYRKYWLDKNKQLYNKYKMNLLYILSESIYILDVYAMDNFLELKMEYKPNISKKTYIISLILKIRNLIITI